MADSKNARKTEATAPALVQPPAQAPKKPAQQFLLDFANDQKDLWSSPKDLRFQDASWLVPLGGFSAGLFVTDSSVSRHLSHDPKTISHYNNLSNAGVAALVGGTGGMWVLSHFNHDGHWRETGFLAGQAAIHSLVMTETLKYSLRRERPYQGDGTGPFFQSGGTSFPSEHAAAAWSIAGVIAHEYPGPLTKFLAYGAASMVTYSRIRAEKHFPSDVLIGALLGQLAAHQIYTKHHDLELAGDLWRSPAHLFYEEGHAKPGFIGSPYVPLDSWIYPAFDRLSALGLIDSGFAGMRPWTRSECARLLGEAGDRIVEGIGGETYRLLESEFRNELEGAESGKFHSRVESVYARVTAISGKPLTDGNHFGQTIINDYGRPYQEGFNSVEGVSAWTATGPWVGYFRAEYQHAPSAAAQSAATRQFIASADSLGVPPATPFAAVNRVRVLDAYVGLNFQNWQITFGKQSLWWSPSQGGPMMFSDNAEPVNMFRINRVSPFKLPSILGWLGPMRVEWFLGQLSGHEFVFQTDTGTVGQFGTGLNRQPFLQGQKISLKPTRNLEFSVSTTTVFAGGPTPLTFHTLLKSYSINGGSVQPGGKSDAGDRRSGVDFTYRVPKLRDWLQFYGEAFDEDEFSPLAYPRKSAYRGGIYLPRIPGIPKLDFRAEGGSTVPGDFTTCVACFYVNHRYPDGSYTNSGNLMGSWLGRAGQGQQVWSTYWLTSRNKIQFNYRHQKVNPQYLPQGGTLNNAGVRADVWLNNMVMMSAAVQYEKWNYPLLDPLPRSNVATSIQFTFKPDRRK